MNIKSIANRELNWKLLGFCVFLGKTLVVYLFQSCCVATIRGGEFSDKLFSFGVSISHTDLNFCFFSSRFLKWDGQIYNQVEIDGQTLRLHGKIFLV